MKLKKIKYCFSKEFLEFLEEENLKNEIYRNHKTEDQKTIFPLNNVLSEKNVGNEENKELCKDLN